MSQEQCDTRELPTSQSTQDLVDSIMQGDKINECDRAELQELLERKQEDENLIHQITHDELRNFIQTEGMSHPWFQEAQEDDENRWIQYYHEKLFESIDRFPNDYWKTERSGFKLTLDNLLNYTTLDTLSFSSEMSHKPLSINGQIYVSEGEKLLNIHTLELVPLENIRSINTGNTIQDGDDIYFEVQYETSRETAYINIEGIEYFSGIPGGVRIDTPNENINIGGIKYYIAKNQENITFLISRNGRKRIFEGEGLSNINLGVGSLSYKGEEYFSVSREDKTFLLSPSGSSLLEDQNLAGITDIQIGDTGNITIQALNQEYSLQEITLNSGDQARNTQPQEAGILDEDVPLFYLYGKPYKVQQVGPNTQMLIGTDGTGGRGGRHGFSRIDTTNIRENNGVSWISVEQGGGQKWYSPEKDEVVDTIN